MSLSAKLKRRITKDGPLRLDEYMLAALADPKEGYYIRKDPLGAAGDFTTAPEICQIFGELVGLWCVSLWASMHQPACTLAELGPGRGTLMADALRASAPIRGFHNQLSVRLVETSPVLREKQWQSLAGKHTDFSWHNHLEDIEPSGPIFILANEFFDALPIRQWEQTPKGWAERCVTTGKKPGRFEFTLDEKSSLPQGFSPPSNAQIVEYCEAANQHMKLIAHLLKKNGGAALIIDYGYLGGTCGDTLQALRDHAFFNPLEAPGTADITAHVDFTALAKIAHAQGLAVYGPIEQGRFLYRLGATLRMTQLMKTAHPEQRKNIVTGVRRLLAPEEMGSLFKVMAIVPNAQPVPDGFDVQELYQP